MPIEQIIHLKEENKRLDLENKHFKDQLKIQGEEHKQDKRFLRNENKQLNNRVKLLECYIRTIKY